MTVPTPELNKLKALEGQKEPVQEFIDWLYEGAGYWICQDLEKEYPAYAPVSKSREQLMADFFGIDMAKVNAEKEAILEDFRQRTAV